MSCKHLMIFTRLVNIFFSLFRTPLFMKLISLFLHSSFWNHVSLFISVRRISALCKKKVTFVVIEFKVFSFWIRYTFAMILHANLNIGKDQGHQFEAKQVLVHWQQIHIKQICGYAGSWKQGRYVRPLSQCSVRFLLPLYSVTSYTALVRVYDNLLHFIFFPTVL